TLAAPPGALASWSALADHLSNIPQEGVAIHDRRPAAVLDNPLLADDALRIDEKKCPVRKHQFLVEDSVAARDLRFGKVAEQRVRQLQRFGERLLRERQVGTDAEVLNPQIYETLEVGLPGRQVRRSRGSEVRPVELEENPLLTPKVIERDIATGGGRQAEGGRWLANLHRRRL